MQMIDQRTQLDVKRPDLRSLPWETLARELMRRGIEPVPAGMFVQKLREVERLGREIAELKAAVAEARDVIPAGMLDATELIDEVKEIAGVQFPALVRDHVALMGESDELSRRAVLAEAEAERLVRALCADLYGNDEGDQP